MIESIKKELSEIRPWMVPILLFIAFPCLIINYYSNNKWFCTFWGWHKEPNGKSFDGCSLKGTCPRCNEEVLQDGNGDWF